MTLPILPCFGYMQFPFDIKRNIAVNESYGGHVATVETAPARWALNGAVTADLTPDQMSTMRAFREEIGVGGRFHVYDYWRQKPKGWTEDIAATHDGTGPVDLTNDVRAATLSDLPPHFQFYVGDMIGLIDGDKRGLHRVTSDVQASAVGEATVNVAPNIRMHAFTVATTYNLIKPVCMMALYPNSWNAEQRYERTPVTFSAIEVFQ